MPASGQYAVHPGLRVLLTDVGVSPDRVLRRAGLPADLFSRGTTMLSPAQYFGLWQALQDESGDPELPLRVGRSISLEAFDPLVFAAFCSPNLLVAAERIARYKRLIGPTRLIVSRADGRTTIECRWPPMAEPPASLSTAELVFWVALTRLATRADVRPAEIAFLIGYEEPSSFHRAFHTWTGQTPERARLSPA